MKYDRNKESSLQAASKPTGSHSHILCRTSPSMTTTSPSRGQKSNPESHISPGGPSTKKGKDAFYLVFQNSVVGGSTYQKPTYWASRIFLSQLFFNSLRPTKIPWDSRWRVFSGFWSKHLYPFGWYDKGATCHHLWFFWNRKKNNIDHHHPHQSNSKNFHLSS